MSNELQAVEKMAAENQKPFQESLFFEDKNGAVKFDVTKLHPANEEHVSNDGLNGTVHRNNETYVVEDNNLLEQLTLSKTILHPGKKTGGHFHDGLEEVYTFVSGQGLMQVGNKITQVSSGSIVMIPAGEWHQVYNFSNTADLTFVCVFQKYERGNEQTS